MDFRGKYLVAAVIMAGTPTMALQAQTAAPSAPVVAPTTPAQTKTTTTSSTTTAQPVPDATGDAVGAQATTNTTATTSTQPATPASPTTTQRSSTTTTAPNPVTGAPATTTTTTTTQPATDKTGATVVAATAADIKAGVPVFDPKGGVVGKVESVKASGVVVSTGKARAEVPVTSFGKNDKGLVMSMTKAELDAATAKAAPTETTKAKTSTRKK